MKPVCTTCPYCGVGCGVIATADGDGGADIKGDPEHPANFGRLCSKGTTLGQTLDHDGRLLSPQVAGLQTDWDEALDLVARKFSETIEKHGPDSVAFYVSGQFLTEDYYVANKLMKGYIGSANIDTNSRLCMASSVAGHKRAFGTDTVPGTYEDLEEADLIVLVGSNLAWCHPVLHQRIMAAKENRDIKIVTIDPRRTATADMADLHLGLASGSDVALFNGLLNRIVGEGAVDQDFVAANVNGFADTIRASHGMSLNAAADATGIDVKLLDQFYALFTGTQKVVTVFSQGVNQSTSGTDKVNAIINCHLATGRIGKPGMGPFSITGQPNAMGGREVGGLANMLAVHLDIENARHRDAVQSFWSSPTIPKQQGLKAVDLFDACASGQIKALWIMCTNPAVSMPRADHVADAIRKCDFVVVSDIIADTDTTRLADVLLPATGWGEKDGTVTNSERRISRQRPFLPPAGMARHDWQIMCDVAKRMGYSGFDYTSPAEIFREFAQMSALAVKFEKDLDLSALATQNPAAYNQMKPIQWPLNNTAPNGRFFGDGKFFTPDQKARMLPVIPQPSPNFTSEAYPLILNTGRIRDHWHTMTRSAKSSQLSQHIAEPFVEIHPETAAQYGIKPADLVRIESAHGFIIARAQISQKSAKDVVFCPVHWTGQWTSKGRVDAVIAPRVDPISGQPELKRSAVSLTRLNMNWFGFGISRKKPTLSTDYWALAQIDGGWRFELAGLDPVTDWTSTARDLTGLRHADPIVVSDQARRTTRLALMLENEVQAVLFTAPDPVAVSRSFMSSFFTSPSQNPLSALAGTAGNGLPDPGAIVCSCFNVGINTIRAAILNQELCTVDQIGKALQAGTNCGSCGPELKSLLSSSTLPIAAE